jgi:hypothetical protein
MTRKNVLPEVVFFITSGVGVESVAATAMVAPHTGTGAGEPFYCGLRIYCVKSASGFIPGYLMGKKK